MISLNSMKPIYFGAALVVLAIIVGAYFVTASPTAAVGSNVTVFYTGRLSNGTVFSSNAGGQPFQFIVGSNTVITGFSTAVVGMRLNQNKTVTIPANQAYGPISTNLILQVPVSAFGNQSIKVGSYVTPNGQQTPGLVTKINSTTVIVNFNNPLAGQALTFNIKVVSIR